MEESSSEKVKFPNEQSGSASSSASSTTSSLRLTTRARGTGLFSLSLLPSDSFEEDTNGHSTEVARTTTRTGSVSGIVSEIVLQQQHPTSSPLSSSSTSTTTTTSMSSNNGTSSTSTSTTSGNPYLQGLRNQLQRMEQSSLAFQLSLPPSPSNNEDTVQLICDNAVLHSTKSWDTSCLLPALHDIHPSMDDYMVFLLRRKEIQAQHVRVISDNSRTHRQYPHHYRHMSWSTSRDTTTRAANSMVAMGDSGLGGAGTSPTSVPPAAAADTMLMPDATMTPGVMELQKPNSILGNAVAAPFQQRNFERKVPPPQTLSPWNNVEEAANMSMQDFFTGPEIAADIIDRIGDGSSSNIFQSSFASVVDHSNQEQDNNPFYLEESPTSVMAIDISGQETEASQQQTLNTQKKRAITTDVAQRCVMDSQILALKDDDDRLEEENL